nr:PREDICTED: uncharacterized protein LOC109030384 [Bemisia tabaci]
MVLKVALSVMFPLAMIEARTTPAGSEDFTALLEEFKQLEPIREAALEDDLRKQRNDSESVKLLESFKEVHSYLTTYRTLYESAYVVLKAMETKRRSKETDQLYSSK